MNFLHTLSKNRISILVIILFLSPLMASGQLSLPRLVSDGMVLQRDAEIKIWGRASSGEKVAVSFMGHTYQTEANSEGEWELKLPEMKAGGPYTMTLKASNTITLSDILIGDVWLCSGQSNMELPMRRVRPLYEDEITHAENNFIRYFEVPKQYDFNEVHEDLPSGQWEKTNPENVLHFSAVSYFFAKNLYEKYQVPIGLINSALGGSPVEAWMSEEALHAFPEHLQEAQRFKDSTLIQQIEQKDQERISAWYQQLNQKDQAYDDPQKVWYEPDLNTSDWASMQIPGYWADNSLGSVNGVVWFRKEIEIPAEKAGKAADLNLGRIVDADSVFVNGKFVGSTGYQYPPRWYTIPAGLLKEGKNILAVRVINQSGKGGFVPDKPYYLAVDADTINLTGNWKYKLGAEMEPLASQTFIRWKPLGLYQAMIAPLLNYRIKGVIWYQGESNADQPEEYAELFPAMIKDWRMQWDQGDFPFLFVQLANFMEAKDQPVESNWAMLREAQRQALSLPETAMAVAIDLGEWNDIHPLNKKDVGTRLALAAQKVAYGDDMVFSGPMYESMKIENDKIILTFENIGGGLISEGGDLEGFAIAGKDRNYVWADARIEGNKVIVWSDEVSRPVAVRYAWADNPEKANLYNQEGLPAAPFQTDTGAIP
ncbi:sialate O-acetylesterase [Catalinimonas sp. 4WD22]|uniref:sialate O-acetylesterase n=1 Tax=Catalinimonas locisalis TaxID=3133978 RepID=UPI003100BC87